MAEIGKFNKLKVVKKLDFGLYLDAGELGEVLLPKKYTKRSMNIGDELDVFLYHDSEDRPIATTLIPKTQVGEFAFLKVVGTSAFGSFMDWGLEKDLLVPLNEQNTRLLRGQHSVVYTYIDKMTGRIAATAKIEKILDDVPTTEYENNQQVDLLIYKETDLGLKAIINNKHTGVLYYNELLAELQIGEKLTGYIKKIREDGKIDLSMQKQGYEKVDEISQNFIDIIKSKGGIIYCSDKSDPDLIYSIFGESKKTYKKVIGNLYRQKLIKIDDEKIVLVTSEEKDE